MTIPAQAPKDQSLPHNLPDYNREDQGSRESCSPQ
jgi:hypothetical protein